MQTTFKRRACAEARAICTCVTRGRLTKRSCSVTVGSEAARVNTDRAAVNDRLFVVHLATDCQLLLVSPATVWEVLDDRDLGVRHQQWPLCLIDPTVAH